MYKTFCDSCGKDITETPKGKTGKIYRVYVRPGMSIELYKGSGSYYVDLAGIWCSVDCFLKYAKSNLQESK